MKEVRKFYVNKVWFAMRIGNIQNATIEKLREQTIFSDLPKKAKIVSVTWWPDKRDLEIGVQE